MINVILAEDHHLVRAGIRALLEKVPDIQIIGEAENGYQAVELAQQMTADVVIMDINMPHLNGIDATTAICQQESPPHVVILSMYSDSALIRQALDSGAKGYLLKHSVTEELLLAIRAAVRGESYLCAGVASIVLEDYRDLLKTTDASTPFDMLTSRERQVLQLIAEGKTNREAAQIMNISERTVEKHRANLSEKLGMHDLAGLIKIAIKHGLITLDN